MNRNDIAELILNRLGESKDTLIIQYKENEHIPHFFLDDLLPSDIAHQIRLAFPSGSAMKIKRSLREHKFIAAQMDNYDPILEECVYAFQDQRVIDMVHQITGVENLEPDSLLYAGGISMMAKDHYLNPHIDNSHDKIRERYRVLNLLYYVSPDWGLENGGNLELWPHGVEGDRITVVSRFNRLAVMATNKNSWHSVSKVLADSNRCCISNYYFSKTSPESKDYFHVTSFRGWPEQKIRDLALRADILIRSSIRKISKFGFFNKTHFYKKK
jgi:Rps23 Pro-64 3,4-dihydroxylase Tpa1-like proline 4-hydroxylase